MTGKIMISEHKDQYAPQVSPEDLLRSNIKTTFSNVEIPENLVVEEIAIYGRPAHTTTFAVDDWRYTYTLQNGVFQATAMKEVAPDIEAGWTLQTR